MSRRLAFERGGHERREIYQLAAMGKKTRCGQAPTCVSNVFRKGILD
jgi:hypothetical protein